MKTEFKTKFLQHLNQKRKEGGFTLIELLVVIIIIGILAAIALPSFLNQAAKAKQSEAKSYVGAINRGQQAYRLENTGFTDKADKLKVGLPTETKNYKYTLGLDGTDGAKAEAKPQDAALRGYAGLVKQTKGGTTGAALCESNEVNQVPAGTVDVTDGKPGCTNGKLVGS